MIVPTVPHLADSVRAATARLARAAAHRRRPRGEVGGVPDRARGAGEIRHGDARAGARRRARWSTAYKVSLLDELIARVAINVPSIILANLVLGENVVPELLQRDCTPKSLADALAPLLTDSPERRRQIEAFARLDAIMEIGRRRRAAAPPRSCSLAAGRDDASAVADATQA